MLIAACPDPECGAPAEIVPWAVAASTNGPVPHVRMQCVNKHRYLLPEAWIPSREADPGIARDRRRTPVEGQEGDQGVPASALDDAMDPTGWSHHGDVRIPV
jgi:hypothetical protein